MTRTLRDHLNSSNHQVSIFFFFFFFSFLDFLILFYLYSIIYLFTYLLTDLSVHSFFHFHFIYASVSLCIHMCMHVCVSVCVCMYACMHFCMYVWMEGYMDRWTYKRVYVWMDRWNYICVRLTISGSMYVCLSVCLYLHTYLTIISFIFLWPRSHSSYFQCSDSACYWKSPHSIDGTATVAWCPLPWNAWSTDGTLLRATDYSPFPRRTPECNYGRQNEADTLPNCQIHHELQKRPTEGVWTWPSRITLPPLSPNTSVWMDGPCSHKFGNMRQTTSAIYLTI